MELGIVWGDAKAENVLNGAEDNAWITDFGGGCIVGWGDAGQEETIEWDTQGPSKNTGFL